MDDVLGPLPVMAAHGGTAQADAQAVVRLPCTPSLSLAPCCSDSLAFGVFLSKYATFLARRLKLHITKHVHGTGTDTGTNAGTDAGTGAGAGAGTGV